MRVLHHSLLVTAASASAAPQAAADRGAAGSPKVVAAPDRDLAAGLAAVAVAARASCVSNSSGRAPNGAKSNRLPPPTAQPRRHYQSFRHHQTSAAIPPECGLFLHPPCVHWTNQEEHTMRKTLIALTATTGLLALGSIGASAAPLQPVHAPPQASSIQQADWYRGPRCDYWRHRHWEEHRWRERNYERYGYNGYYNRGYPDLRLLSLIAGWAWRLFAGDSRRSSLVETIEEAPCPPCSLPPTPRGSTRTASSSSAPCSTPRRANCSAARWNRTRKSPPTCLIASMHTALPLASRCGTAPAIRSTE